MLLERSRPQDFIKLHAIGTKQIAFVEFSLIAEQLEIVNETYGLFVSESVEEGSSGLSKERLQDRYDEFQKIMGFSVEELRDAIENMEASAEKLIQASS